MEVRINNQPFGSGAKNPYLVPRAHPIRVSALVRRRILIDVDAGVFEEVERAAAASELLRRRAEVRVDSPDDAPDGAPDETD